jgi:hypothetical protein
VGDVEQLPPVIRDKNARFNSKKTIISGLILFYYLD